MTKSQLKRHLKYLVPEVRLALIREPSSKPPLEIRCPADIEQFVEPLKFYSEEFFVCFYLNSRQFVTSYNVTSHGTVSASLVHCREVFKAAILANSHSIIVAHNHPGGSMDPSADDLATTKTLIAAGQLLGVNVIDHIIVSFNGIKSLREYYPELWASEA